MAKFHVNPTTGKAGACSARVQCPFGGEAEHYASEAEARAAYEATQGSFRAPVKLQPVPTPSKSYLDPDGAREMWARGAKVNQWDSPPAFNLPKPLGTRQGFMAGGLYDSASRRWLPTSFTPDGKLAFVDVNRTFSSRAELEIRKWDEAAQEWKRLYKRSAGDQADVAHALSEHGYKRTTTGMIAARDVRRLRQDLTAAGAERPSSGEVDPTMSNAIAPPKLSPA